MIPDYKLYHGAVLADIVDRFNGPVSFKEVVDPGRLLNYVVNDVVGLQIRYSTARLRPWGFSFSQAHLNQLRSLLQIYPATFAVLVCHTDGFVTIGAEQLLASCRNDGDGQAWFRVNRKKREMYQLFGPAGEFPLRFRTTSEPVVEALDRAAATTTSRETA